MTILVPTYNRYPHLARLLRYAESARLPWLLRILDSSSEPLGSESLRQRLGRGDVEWLRYPSSLPPMQKLLEGLAGVETSYVVVWNDDDLLATRTLAEGVRFLEAHSDYSVVHGRSAAFRPRATPDGVRIEALGRYPHQTVTGPSAAARLRSHFTRYHAALNSSIHRAAWLRKNVEQCCAQGFGYRWAELALGALDVIQGNAHALPRLYLCKEVHAGGADAWIRFLAEGRADAGGPWQEPRASHDVFDWVTEPSFPGKYAAFQQMTAEALMAADGLPPEAARVIVKQAFWSHVAQDMTSKQRWSWGRRVPPWRWRALSHALRGGWDTMSLKSLLRPNSPHHRDFLPIYEAITKC